jgi:hypothetical protein
MLTNADKGPMSVGITLLKYPMTCFEERTSIWLAVGAWWRTKLSCSEVTAIGGTVAALTRFVRFRTKICALEGTKGHHAP